jgi:hypothetical protein
MRPFKKRQIPAFGVVAGEPSKTKAATFMKALYRGDIG